MKIAIFGGTHGNEPVGAEVVKALRQLKPESLFHTFETFIGNPEALKKQVRYIDTDLNRAFGKNGKPLGAELKRSLELTSTIKNNFDFIIDLHTTTTNMGLTGILNNTHLLSRRAASYLKKKCGEKNEDFKIIEEIDLDEDSNHLGRLAPACITIEVGPVANNVISGGLVLKTYQMVLDLLNYDFKTNGSSNPTEVYKTKETLCFPEGAGWLIHPDLENNDFCELKNGDPLFFNIINGKTISYTKKMILHPFFINEAAYLENKTAMLLAQRVFMDM